MKTFLLLVIFASATAAHRTAFAQQFPLIIAHRGTSGYLPEHTLEAKALAYGMGADYIEQDVVLSKDGVPVVLHDIHVDTVTNVAAVFPKRSREDGRYYAIDFSIDEIKRLQVNERIDQESKRAVFPRRFPLNKSRFEVATLAEEIELIQGLNRSTGRNVGIYVEVKSPAWHREQGRDISKSVLALLTEYGYHDKSDAVFVQCFDAVELRRMREELGAKLKLVQLIGNNSKESTTDYDALRTAAGLSGVAGYADAIGPSLEHVIDTTGQDAKPITTDLVQLAHAAGLKVHPYTFRSDKLPKYALTFDHLLKLFVEAKVDGIFTDFPDTTRGEINSMRASK